MRSGTTAIFQMCIFYDSREDNIYMVGCKSLQMVLELIIDFGIGVCLALLEVFVYWPRNLMRHNEDVVSTMGRGGCL